MNMRLCYHSLSDKSEPGRPVQVNSVLRKENTSSEAFLAMRECTFQSVRYDSFENKISPIYITNT